MPDSSVIKRSSFFALPVLQIAKTSAFPLTAFDIPMLRPFELARVQVVKIKELRVKVLVVSCADVFEVFVELLVPLGLIAVSL